MENFAYLQFKASDKGPFQTVKVPRRYDFLPRKGQTVSGYGNAIPTVYLVKWAGRWRRVKVCQFGNAGTAYIGKPGAWLATVSDA